jgi:hypothetical protein
MANGSKVYGVCHTTYIPTSAEQNTQLEKMLSEWRRRNLKESDVEFASHIQTQIACEKERLLKLNAMSSDENLQEKLDSKDMIGVLEELLTPLRTHMLMDTESIFVPSCTGVISKWPWYDLLKDWLSLLNSAIQENGFNLFPFERYVINLIEETPLPPPGKLELGISFGSFTLYCSRPPLNSCPLLKNVLL